MIDGKTYYVIIPNNSFLQKLEEYGIASFRGPRIWEIFEGGRRVTITDRKNRLKLLHIARFRTELSGYQYVRQQDFLDDIMGRPPFTLSVFNRWWTIERVTGIAQLPDAIEFIDIEQLDMLAKTKNSELDQWIAQLKDHKRSMKTPPIKRNPEGKTQ